MRKSSALPELIEKWRTVDLSKPPLLFPGDDPQPSAPFYNFDGFVSDPEFGHPNDKRFHLGLIPCPYAGNVLNASIYVLTLNPGFGASDYFAEEHPGFREVMDRNLRQVDLGRFPFWPLNPRWSWHSGARYWREGKLDGLLRKMENDYRTALKLLANELCVLERVPYHSRQFGGRSRLASSDAIRSHVHEHLLPRAKSGDALIIVTRNWKEWGLSKGRGVIIYDRPGEARSASLSPDSRGGAAILRFIRRRYPGR